MNFVKKYFFSKVGYFVAFNIEENSKTFLSVPIILLLSIEATKDRDDFCYNTKGEQSFVKRCIVYMIDNTELFLSRYDGFN